jgi:lysine 2,3-aminomutase
MTLGLDPERIGPVMDRYPVRITRHYARLIREQGDPIWRQAVPDPRELDDLKSSCDPLNEEGLTPVPGLIHRYPDRAVFLVSNSCAVYCRFCMRKRRVGCSQGQTTPDTDEVVAYLRAHPEITDIILSGGDPLLLDDDELESILSSLSRIPSLQIIRIGTRVPVTLPERITSRLCAIIKRYPPLYINTHFNHPREITPESRVACARLVAAGAVLGNQTVLLRGVNDRTEVMAELNRGLLAMRVRPYYLHQMDLVRGTAHFRTSVARGLQIMSGLRGHVSGLAIPYYVIDLPGGKGKVPILPQSDWRAGEVNRLVTYTGELVEYPDISDDHRE